MFQRFLLAVQDNKDAYAGKNGKHVFFLFDTKISLFSTLHHLTLALGLAAILVLTMMFIKPDLAEKFQSLSPFAVSSPALDVNNPVPPSLALLMATPEQLAQPNTVEVAASAIDQDSKISNNDREQQWVTSWLAKRYRVASDASDMLVSAAYVTAKEIKLDPLLILSVMAIESGLNPFAESPVGAQGLMQVMSKIHHEKFEEMGGIKAALNPIANIKVGALILKDYVTRGGSVEAGLKLYVGAAAFDNDAGYGSRVMAEYRRLKDVAIGKNVSIFITTPAQPALARPQEATPGVKLETLTEHKNVTIENKLPEQIARL
ncbi:MAG: transglycosylase SLT domain-containing protein [Pseudomonadota bacterium]